MAYHYPRMGTDSGITSILSTIKEQQVDVISFQFVDITGNLKSVGVPSKPEEQLESYFERGIGFDGSSVEGFVRIAESDLVLKPDLKTFKVLPWSLDERKEARVLCDVYRPGGFLFEGDPRYVLKKVLGECETLGFKYMVGPELEFFLFEIRDTLTTKPVPSDVGGYFDYAPLNQATRVVSESAFALQQLGISVERFIHEVPQAQYEIDFKFSDALASADNVITYKYTVKTIALKHGLYASFMPKPLFGVNGSGMHTHQSLSTIDGKNAFFDAEDSYNLSKTARHFLGGQIKHIRGITATLAPTVNSYKRLVPGYEAPVYICWARRNRSALVRVPEYFPGSEQAIRLELRCPDPSCNPYLAFATMLEAGLDGIRNKVEPPKPVEEDVYEFDDEKLRRFYIDTLPGSLGEALDEYGRSQVAKKALGEFAYEKLQEALRKEWDDYRIQVHPWEVDRYLKR